ncbi:MAG TPA: hypothetical protein VHO06_20245 [Polyangia bacterium]|nr:hypothetical protein [Polyangia bacterium]
MTKGILRPAVTGMGVLASLALVACGSSGNSRPGGTGGTSATGGSSSGGSTGTGGGASGGATGSGGAAGATTLACTANPTTALLTNFGSAAGDGGVSTNGQWGTTGQLTGHTFGYKGALTNDAGVMSSVMATINRSAGNMELKGTVVAADYAGGGMSFDTCVDSSMWTGIQFTLGGTADGCNITFQLQTESQEPPSNKGTCTGSCYDFPQIAVTIPATAGTPTVVKFSDLTATGMPSAPADFEKEMFGLQWQFSSAAPPDGGVQAGCSPDMTISDVMWTSN